MKGMYMAEERKKLIEELKSVIYDATKEGMMINEQRLLSQFAFKTGLRDSKIKEYLNILLNMDLITKTGNGYGTKFSRPLKE
jgi:hypothetical protein